MEGAKEGNRKVGRKGEIRVKGSQKEGRKQETRTLSKEE